MGCRRSERGPDEEVAQIPVALEGCKGRLVEEGLELGVTLKNREVVQEDALHWEIVGVEGQAEQGAILRVKLSLRGEG